MADKNRKKEIIENKNNTTLNSKKTSFSIYFKSKENFRYWLLQRKNKKISLSKKQEIILKLLNNQTTIWLDGFGFALRCFNDKIISIEQHHFKNILGKVKNNNHIYFSNNLFSEKSLNTINKKFLSNIIVLDSQILEYITSLEIINFLRNLHNYTIHHLIFLFLRFSYFHQISILLVHSRNF